MLVPEPQDPRFGYTPLPSWVRGFRSTQWEKIEEVNEAFKENDVVFLQAPTGTGKSLIGEVTRRLLRTTGIYCCTTKNLQDQFASDFSYAKVVKGRANYLTLSGKLDEFGNASSSLRWSAVTCADCTYTPQRGSCRWCIDRTACPYQEAKQLAVQSELAVLNTSYFINSCKGLGDFSGRGLVVLDEADLLEHELLNHVEVDISPARMERLKMAPPKVKTAVAKGNDWVEWVGYEAIPKTAKYFANLPSPYDEELSVAEMREWNGTRELLVKLTDLKDALPTGGWIYDGYDRDHVIFRPVRVDNYGNSLLWPHGRKFLLMSATILSDDLMAEELGLTKDYTLVDVPSGFDKKNRPIYVVPVADMGFKNRDEAWPEMVRAIAGVLRQHPNERVLIHTVSYEFSRYLKDELKLHPTPPTEFSNRPIITYSESAGKEAALRQYRNVANAVLVAASMDRGVDLPDDLCRVQVVAKIPFPNLKDKRVNSRLYSVGGSAWYSMQTIRTLIQMCGRGVRHEDDKAVTYILDSQFITNLWKSKRWLFPEWWREAVRWDYPKRRLLG